jgi:anti-sigma factor RsiW
MNCSRDLIEAYMDEELDPGLTISVEEHLSGCQSCSEIHSRFRQQRADIRSAAPYYTAPAQLERSIRDSLRQAAAKETKATANNQPWRWLAIAASVLLTVSVSWNMRPSSKGIAENDVMAQNILADHVRSLIGTHLMDVPSTDQHTVKPWFNGKLDFSPEVKDFAAQGFPLIGGRLDYLADRTVAALVYGRRRHIINVFTWPTGPAPTSQSQFSRNGYNAIHWSHGSMTFWAVSDIALPELAQFKDLYEK